MIRDWAHDLPPELLELIFMKLFANDRVTFGMVCQSWNYVAKTTRCSSIHGDAPCLMFYNWGKHEWKFFQLYNGSFYKDIPKLQNAVIRCSKHGWLLMSSYDLSLFFFDPFNGQKIRELPKHEVRYTTICFFNDPDSSDWVVIGISNALDRTIVRLGVLKHGYDEWKVVRFKIPIEFDLSVCTPIWHCGMLYCLNVQGGVAAFDLNDDDSGLNSSWEVYSCCLFPSRLRRKLKQQFLIKHIEGIEVVLFAVFLTHDGRNVRVYRADLDLKEGNDLIDRWQVVDDLGDKALFVSPTASYAVTTAASNSTMANKIFFNKFHDDSLVYYSLKTQKYHSLNKNFSSNNSCDLKEYDFATWIMPTIS